MTMNEPATQDGGNGPMAGGQPQDSPADRGAARPAFWNRRWFLAVLLIVVTFVAYGPVWQAGFVWDDDAMLTGNRFVQTADGLRAIWFSARLPDYFPMTSTALWVEWRLWGANPLGYHLVNVLLHALSAVLWWRVLQRLKIPGAWLAAAVFALHPVNVESVAWIAELKNTLAMVFYAFTLLAYLRFDDSGRWRWYGLAVGAFVLALLSKTAVAPLPLVLLGLAWWGRGRVVRRDVWRSVPFFAASAGLALVSIWFQHHQALGSALVRDDDFWSRLAGAGWAVWFYLYKTVLPANLIFIYPRWEITAANVLSYVPGLLAVAGLLLCWRHRRQWGKGWLFGLGYFVVLLLPVLGFFNISFMRHSLVADRWQYFAILGPIALIAAFLTTALGSVRETKPFLTAALGGALLLVLGALTWRQSRMYRDSETLWQTTLARNPNCPVAYNDLGNALLRKGRVDDAIAHYQKALAILPDYGLAHYNLGYALLQMGQVDESVAHFQTAVALQPNLVPAHQQLGNFLMQKGQVDEAAVHFQTVLEIQPDFAEAHYQLGNVFLQKGEVDQAIAHLQKAMAIEPGSAYGHNDLGVALIQKGKEAQATAHFQKALEIQPDFAEAHNNLGKVLLQKGRAQDAVAHYRTALKLQPDDPATLSNLAWVLATWPEASIRNGAEAIELAQRANQFSGGQDPSILRVLAASYAEDGRLPEAMATAGRALQLAEARSDEALADELRSQIKLYQPNSPIRDAVPAPRSAN